MNTTTEQFLSLSETIVQLHRVGFQNLELENELLLQSTVLVTAMKDQKFRRLRRYLNLIKERRQRQPLTTTWVRSEKKNLSAEDVFGRSFDLKDVTGLESEVFEDVFGLVGERLTKQRKKYVLITI